MTTTELRTATATVTATGENDTTNGSYTTRYINISDTGQGSDSIGLGSNSSAASGITVFATTVYSTVTIPTTITAPGETSISTSYVMLPPITETTTVYSTVTVTKTITTAQTVSTAGFSPQFTAICVGCLPLIGQNGSLGSRVWLNLTQYDGMNWVNTEALFNYSYTVQLEPDALAVLWSLGVEYQNVSTSVEINGADQGGAIEGSTFHVGAATVYGYEISGDWARELSASSCSPANCPLFEYAPGQWAQVWLLTNVSNGQTSTTTTHYFNISYSAQLPLDTSVVHWEIGAASPNAMLGLSIGYTAETIGELTPFTIGYINGTAITIYASSGSWTRPASGWW